MIKKRIAFLLLQFFRILPQEVMNQLKHLLTLDLKGRNFEKPLIGEGGAVYSILGSSQAKSKSGLKGRANNQSTFPFQNFLRISHWLKMDSLDICLKETILSLLIQTSNLQRNQRKNQDFLNLHTSDWSKAMTMNAMNKYFPKILFNFCQELTSLIIDDNLFTNLNQSSFEGMNKLQYLDVR